MRQWKFDASRYEGHNGPYRIMNGAPKGQPEDLYMIDGHGHALWNACGSLSCDSPDRNLLADAPTLLELVLQQREALVKLRDRLATLEGLTKWQCTCGGINCEGQRENEWLRQRVAELERRVTELSHGNTAADSVQGEG